jgi:hypothetical protein
LSHGRLGVRRSNGAGGFRRPRKDMIVSDRDEVANG